MKKKKNLVEITIKNRNGEKAKLQLPCDTEKIDEFFRRIKGCQNRSDEDIYIYSNCGVKILDRNIIVGINDKKYTNKNICNLGYEDLEEFIIILNGKVEKLSSKFVSSQVALLSDCISTNIDKILDFVESGKYTVFDNKTLKEVAFEEEKIQGKEDSECQYLMNSLGYFETFNAVIKFDIEQVHLKETVLTSYLECLYYNTVFKVKDEKYVCVEIPEKTLKFKYNVQEMFDECMDFECKDRNEENIRRELESYREMFERECRYKYPYYDEYPYYYEYISNCAEIKFDELIDYRKNIQKDMMDRIDCYYNGEDWYCDFENNIDRNKSLKEIQEELKTTFFKKIINNFIVGEFYMWYEFWRQV